MTTQFDSGYDLVEILGELIGEGEFIGDESGDDSSGDEIGAAIDAILSGALPKKRPMFRPGAKRPMPRRPGTGLARPGFNAAAVQKTALLNALMERRAQAGAMLSERAPTKSREYPLGFVSAAALAAGASARITTRPQVPFRLDRLVVPSDLAGLFTIDDVKVGKNSQFAAEGSVPARIFQENAVGVCLKGDTAQISMDVTIVVTNISGAAAFFRAAIIGPAVE